jgi:hypothetical protein
MKFWDLALMMIIINVFGAALIGSGLFTQMGMTETFEFGDTTQADFLSIEQGAKSSIADSISSDDPTTEIFGRESISRAKSVSNFFDKLFAYIFWPAKLMQMFNVPSQIGMAFTTLFNGVQIIGIIQFITGRNLRDYE